MKNILMVFILVYSSSIFALETTGDRYKVISSTQQVKLRKAGLKLNRSGRKFLEKEEKLKKGQEYEITLKCIAGSRKKCLLIRLDDLK